MLRAATYIFAFAAYVAICFFVGAKPAPAQAGKCIPVEQAMHVIESRKYKHFELRDEAMKQWVALAEEAGLELTYDDPDYVLVVFDAERDIAFVAFATGDAVCDLLQMPLARAKAMLRPA